MRIVAAESGDHFVIELLRRGGNYQFSSSEERIFIQNGPTFLKVIRRESVAHYIMKEIPSLLIQRMENFSVGAVFILVDKISTPPLALVESHRVVFKDYPINQEICILRVSF